MGTCARFVPSFCRWSRPSSLLETGMVRERAAALTDCPRVAESDWHGVRQPRNLRPAAQLSSAPHRAKLVVDTPATAPEAHPDVRGSCHGFPARLPHPWMKASRSALIVSASVVGMPCGKPL